MLLLILADKIEVFQNRPSYAIKKQHDLVLRNNDIYPIYTFQNKSSLIWKV